MSIVKLNNKAVSNATAFGSISSLGSMTFIKKLTASSSATLSFVHGTDGVVLDDTYKEYVFTFNNIHPATDLADFSFNMSTDGGSNYNVTKTSTYFKTQHQGSTGSFEGLNYFTNGDLAQSTGFQRLTEALEADVASANMSGYLHLFNPSSDTFVKHFIYVDSEYGNDFFAVESFVAGYGNTQSPVNAIQYKFDTGNIDAGDICLYGIA